MDALGGLPIHTSRHIRQLALYTQLADKSVPLIVPHGGQIWDEPLWEDHGHSTAKVFEEVTNNIERRGHMVGNGRFMALVPSSGNFASCLAELLLGQMEGPGDQLAESIEKSVMRWMCDVVGYPKTADGYLTSGGSSSTVVAIATARELKGCKAADYDRLVVYIQPRTHIALDRALEVVGLGSCIVHQVKVDDDHRMSREDLEECIDRHKKEGLIPFLVAGTIGTTDLGSIDPIKELAAIATKHDIWFHVDGAIGGFYALCDKMKVPYEGLSQADSIILDPHKSLSQPYGYGAVLFKDGTLKDTCCRPTGSEETPFWRNPLEEQSMFRSFVVWFSTQVFGVATFRDILNRNLEQAQYVYDQIRVLPELLVLPLQQSIVVFRCKGNPEVANVNTDLMSKIIEKRGVVRLTPTIMDGFRFIRIPVCNHHTFFTEIELCLEEIRNGTQEVFNRPVDRERHETSANITWLQTMEATFRAREFQLGQRYLDRVLAIVYNRVLHGETEHDHQAPAVDDIKELLKTTIPDDAVEAIQMEKLLEIASTIHLPHQQKPLCRLAGTVGHFVSATFNCMGGLRWLEPGCTELEEKIISSFASSLGMSAACRGVLASNSWTANMLGLIAARNAKLVTSAEFHRAVVYTDALGNGHFRIPLGLVGLGECIVRTVKTNTCGELDIDDLNRKVTEDEKDPNILPWLVAQHVPGDWSADHTRQVAGLCDLRGLWHHVDLAADSLPRLLKNLHTKHDLGLSLTNSASVNIGKHVCLPVGVAAAIIRDHEHLYRAMAHHRPPEYLPEEWYSKNQSVGDVESARSDDSNILPVYDAKSYSFEMSRPFRALPLWFTLRLLGIDACCE